MCSEKGRKEFKAGEINLGSKKVGEKWKEFEGKIKKALKEIEEEMEGARKRRAGWWDKECVEKKEIKRELRD